MRFQFEHPHTTFNPRFMDEIGRIDFHVVNSQFIYLHLLMQKRPQTHIGNNLTDISNRVFHLRKRVVGLYGFHAFNA